MQNTEALQTYFGRVTPAIPELFNMAHAICGSRELAVYALQYALVEAWLGEGHGGVGFREGLRYTLRGIAIEGALGARAGEGEFTWNGLSGGDDPVISLIAQEPLPTQRALALRYGCGLPAAKIARLTGSSAGRVRELLRRFERRAARQLGARGKGRCEAQIARAVRRTLGRPDAAMPSMSAIYRAFASEAAETRRPKHLAVRIVRRILYAVLILLCALVFWLAAVLIRPTVEPVSAESAAAWEAADGAANLWDVMKI